MFLMLNTSLFILLDLHVLGKWEIAELILDLIRKHAKRLSG